MHIKVVLIDDKKASIERLETILGLFNEVIIIGKTTDAKEGIKIIEQQKPHIAFLDIEMPEIDGFEVIKYFNGTGNKTEFIISTGYNQYMLESFRNKAFDFLEKPISIVELKNCFLRYKKEVLFQLSERDIQLIKLICLGFNSREIGEKLFLAKSTIDSYRKKILEKTDCRNTAELVHLFSTSF